MTISLRISDLSYDMLATLETNAILVTNGDDDTRPGWILIKIVGKPDLSIFHIQ
jgi:hypothetical protein